jgi:hypothetical protein
VVPDDQQIHLQIAGINSLSCCGDAGLSLRMPGSIAGMLRKSVLFSL